MKKNDYKKLLENIKALKRKLPGKSYFNSLEKKVEEKIKKECLYVENLLLDYLENNISKSNKERLENHIKICKNCKKELELTKSLLENKNLANTDDNYFENLTNSILDKTIYEKTPKCEIAENYLIDILEEEKVNEEISSHVKACPHCQKELLSIKNLVEKTKELEIIKPNESFFIKQLNSINTKVDKINSENLEKTFNNFRNYMSDLIESVKIIILRPSTAMALSIMLIIFFIGSNFFNLKENREINFSENNLNSSFANTEETIIKNKVSTPLEDEKIELKQTGTAKKKDDKKSKLN
jgi:hypothetical protein